MKISMPLASLLAGLLTLSALSWAQAEEVPGLVLDAATGLPLEGANVQVGNTATTTDAQGRFKVEAAPGDSLNISFIGYQRARVAVVLPLVVALERTVLQVPAVVVEGGLMRQRLDRLAASVTVVDGDRSRASGAGHLQDATHAVPNLNWAGGSSRRAIPDPGHWRAQPLRRRRAAQFFSGIRHGRC